MKTVVLIRHGQSLGQTAYDNGISRKDKSLLDCFLTDQGIREALELRSNETIGRHNFDLVCTSPLTRAVATCVLGLGHITEHEMEKSADGLPVTPFIAHSYISEAGKGIPENHGRAISVLKKDLREKLSTDCPSSSSLLFCGCRRRLGSGCCCNRHRNRNSCLDHVDFSLLPSSWPVVKIRKLKREKDRIQMFLEWLAERDEKCIAVVCHFHIIIWLLNNSIDYVPNCEPIECVLLMDGPPRLVQKSYYEYCKSERIVAKG